MSTLSRAIAIAAEAHAGQIDKQGEVYIFHPLRVMMLLPSNPLELRIIGVLHDVIEDCVGWTWLRLRSEGFSDEVLSGLRAVTRRLAEKETYAEFISRCREHPLGKVVKIGDVKDNLSRIELLSDDGDRERLRRRYLKALAELRKSKGVTS